MEFYPLIENSGFAMNNYYVWCGSCIKDKGIYYLFASRWKKSTGFPEGYMIDSEIVLATTNDLAKPFEFKKVVISKRVGGYWDSMMATNPYILKAEDKYILYYIGSPDGKLSTRSIGYAVCESIDGEWRRSDKPINLPKDANNPAVLYDRGKYLLYFRDGNLKVSVAEAKDYNQPYSILKYDIFPDAKIEDMFVYKDKNGKFIILAEDNDGYYTGVTKGGVKFESENAVDWKLADDPLVYDFQVKCGDGKVLYLDRRERPFLLFDDNSTYLFTAVKADGDTVLTGGKTWNMVQKIKNVL